MRRLTPSEQHQPLAGIFYCVNGEGMLKDAQQQQPSVFPCLLTVDLMWCNFPTTIDYNNDLRATINSFFYCFVSASILSKQVRQPQTRDTYPSLWKVKSGTPFNKKILLAITTKYYISNSRVESLERLEKISWFETSHGILLFIYIPFTWPNCWE